MSLLRPVLPVASVGVVSAGVVSVEEASAEEAAVGADVPALDSRVFHLVFPVVKP